MRNCTLQAWPNVASATAFSSSTSSAASALQPVAFNSSNLMAQHHQPHSNSALNARQLADDVNENAAAAAADDSHEDADEEFNAGTTANSKELNYGNGGEYVKDRNVSGGRKRSVGGAKFNQINGGGRRAATSGAASNNDDHRTNNNNKNMRRSVRDYHSSSTASSSLHQPSASVAPSSGLPSGWSQSSEANQNSDNINRNEYAAKQPSNEDESIKSRSTSSALASLVHAKGTTTRLEDDEWRRKLQRMLKRQVVQEALMAGSTAAAASATNDLSTTKSAIEDASAQRLKRTADTSQTHMANVIAPHHGDAEGVHQTPSQSRRRSDPSIVSFLHANLSAAHHPHSAHSSQHAEATADHQHYAASPSTHYSSAPSSIHHSNVHNNGADSPPFDSVIAQPSSAAAASTVIELKCLAGYDGGLPQVFILEAYDSRTRHLRLNLTSVDSVNPTFRIDLAGKYISYWHLYGFAENY